MGCSHRPVGSKYDLVERLRSGKSLVVVAHPDDEILWAGGTILANRHVDWEIIALCRAGDEDRAPKFRTVVRELGAIGSIGDLDDEADQAPLERHVVGVTALSLLANASTGYAYVLTHSPFGEYTRHRRHEEIGRAMITLWANGDVQADNLWMFAFEDGGGRYLPRAIESAHRNVVLPTNVWIEKYRLITQRYGFPEEGFEAKTTPRKEAFWCFGNTTELDLWLTERGMSRESLDDV